MGSTTARLGLFKSDGGDLASDPHANFGNAFDLIDQLLPEQLVTSSTHPSSPFTGQMILETDTFKLFLWNGGAWVQIWTATDVITSAADTPGYKNRIINGDFAIAQKGLSVVTNTSGNPCDMWVYTNGAAQTGALQINTSPGGSGNVTDAGNVLQWNKTNQVAPDSNLRQRQEDASTFAGVQVTFSIWARSTVTVTLTPKITQNFGTGGSPTTAVATSGAPIVVDNSNVWKRYSSTITVPNVNGSTFGTNKDDYIEYSLTRAGGDTIGLLQLTKIQAEAGTIATQYERRHKSLELLLCQRYLQRLGTVTTVFSTGRAVSATQALAVIPLSVPMRAVPTLGISGATSFSVNGTGTSAVAQSGTNGPNSIAIALTTTGLTTGQAVSIGGTAGTSIIDASAEL